MPNINKQVGEKIRRSRLRKNWLQRELARTANLPVRTIGRIERGEVDARLSNLEKIAKALRIKMEELFS